MNFFLSYDINKLNLLKGVRMDNHYRIDEDCMLFREMRGLSQTELAKKLGLGLATVNRW